MTNQNKLELMRWLNNKMTESYIARATSEAAVYNEVYCYVESMIVEPRVFNVGDFYGKEFGYLEYRTVRPGFSDFDLLSVLIVDIDEENVTVVFRSASVQKLPLDRMNKNWRIWSDYPTHKLLRAVKWE